MRMTDQSQEKEDPGEEKSLHESIPPGTQEKQMKVKQILPFTPCYQSWMSFIQDNLTNNSLGVVFKTKHLQPSPKTFTTGIQ